MATAAGILAIVGGLLAVVASAVPFVTYSFGSTHVSSSIFSPGPHAPGADYWFVVEPVGVVLLGILGGVLLLVQRRGHLPAVAAGGLVALGIQTLFLFAGYAFGYQTSGNHAGAGGPIGLVAGVLLAVGGFMGLAGVARDRQSQSPGTSGHAAGAGAPATYQPPYPPR